LKVYIGKDSNIPKLTTLKNNSSLLIVSGRYKRYLPKTDLDKVLRLFHSIIKLRYNIIVSLTFSSSKEMKKVNSEYRGVNKSTDVISFPCITELYETDRNLISYRYLGEIMIDINYIKQQEDTMNIAFEIIKTFIHGLLHLAGYDHLNNIQSGKMFLMENTIINEVMKG